MKSRASVRARCCGARDRPPSMLQRQMQWQRTGQRTARHRTICRSSSAADRDPPNPRDLPAPALRRFATSKSAGPQDGCRQMQGDDVRGRLAAFSLPRCVALRTLVSHNQLTFFVWLKIRIGCNGGRRFYRNVDRSIL
jgi:hypothetical protein